MTGGYEKRIGTGLVGVVILVLVLLLDQLSKFWIVYIFNLPARGSVSVMPHFNLTMGWNKAITFGMLGELGQLSQWVFISVAGGIILVLLRWLFVTEKKIIAIAIGAISGGALGNVIDRIRFGAVVDFIHFHIGEWSWYVFNLADSAIVCGVIILMIESFFSKQAGSHE